MHLESGQQAAGSFPIQRTWPMVAPASAPSSTLIEELVTAVKKGWAVLLAVFGCEIVLSVVHADEPAYPLYCVGKFPRQSIGYADAKVTLAIQFRHGAQASGVHAPASGECTWVDRVLLRTEPSELRYAIRATSLGISTDAGRPEDGMGVLINGAAEADYLMFHCLHRHANQRLGFYVTVRNDGRGGFEVIRVHPEYCPR